MPRGNFMLNYFGFGGNNTSLIVSNLRSTSDGGKFTQPAITTAATDRCPTSRR
jgi:hypothetical protein